MKVLIIDDNEDFATALVRLLTIAGYGDSRCAYGGLEGIKIAKKMKTDFLLIDLSMPGMDGFEVAKIIRKELAASKPTLVAITGYGQESDHQATRESHFDFHLTKPFGFEVLKQILGVPQRVEN